MAKPYALFAYAKNTRDVLMGFSIDAEIMNNITPKAAWTLGKVEGHLEQLILLLAPSEIVDNPTKSNEE